MKPNFALGLTDDGITLWQRDAAGWLRVGAVAPDAADMEGQMQGLVKIASALAPDGVHTKLVVPDDQILFCDLPVAARNREMQGHEIRAQLAGRTPYPVEELDFDWTVTDGMARVAVVARETLVEAEDFARGLGLNPVSSVGAPANGGFPQEPYFGHTRVARDIIGDVSRLERDREVLRETGIAHLPEPELVATPEPAPAPEKKAAPEKPAGHDTGKVAKPDDTAGKAPEAAAKAEVKPNTTAKPDGDAESETAQQPKAATKADAAPKPMPEAKSEPAPETKPASEQKTAAETKPAPEGASARKDNSGQDAKTTHAAAKPTASATNKPTENVEKSTVAAAPVPPTAVVPTPTASATASPENANSADTQKSALLAKLRAAKSASESRNSDAPRAESMNAFDRARQKLSEVLPTKQSASKSDAPSEADASANDDASVSFRSRRAASTASDAPLAAKANAPTADPAPKDQEKPSTEGLGGLRAKLAGAQNLSKRKLGGLTKALGATASAKTTQQETPPSKAPAETATRPAAEKPVAAKAKAKASTETASAYPLKIGAGAATATRKDPLETLQSRAGKTSAASASEAERLTIFGARGQSGNTRETPKRAMLVFAGLGLILVAVAIWAAYFFSSTPAAPEMAEQVDPPSAPAPLVTSEAEADTALPEIAEDIEAALGLEDAAQQQPMDAPEPEAAPMDEAAQQADTIAEEAPVAESEQPTGRVAGVRTSALLAPQDHLPLPDAPTAPAPFGADPLPPLRSEVEQAAQAQADAPDAATDEAPASGGEIASALPEGEEALEIAVTEGTPAVIPPARPEGLAPEVEAIDAAIESALQGLTPESDLIAIPEGGTTPDDAADALAVPETPLDPLDESNLEIVVTEGTPAVVPPARPEGLAPEPPAPAPAAADPAAVDPATVDPAATDPGSEALAPPASGEPLPDPSADQAELDAPPPGGVALSALRPATRPSNVADLAEAARAAAETPVIEGTALAVAASARPGARPSQFAALVQRSLSAAQARSAPAAVAAPAPAAEAPVQTARAAVPAAPPIPSSASVAREATQARAINLRQINLIGVMGTSSARRALVRLSNGRVVTVRVGDSLDSGNVTAISDSELRYVRRGRDVVLRIAS